MLLLLLLCEQIIFAERTADHNTQHVTSRAAELSLTRGHAAKHSSSRGHAAKPRSTRGHAAKPRVVITWGHAAKSRGHAAKPRSTRGHAASSPASSQVVLGARGLTTGASAAAEPDNHLPRGARPGASAAAEPDTHSFATGRSARPRGSWLIHHQIRCPTDGGTVDFGWVIPGPQALSGHETPVLRRPVLGARHH